MDVGEELSYEELVLQELDRIGDKTSTLNYSVADLEESTEKVYQELVTLNANVHSILVEVEIIAMAIIAIWLMNWIRRVFRKRRKVDD